MFVTKTTTKLGSTAPVVALAMLVVAAVGASAASAAQLHFKAVTYPVKIKAHGTEVQAFKIGTITVECPASGSTFGPTAALGAESISLLISASYTSCKAFGFTEATINMKGCEYLFHVGEALSGNTVSIVCPEGAKIQITDSLTTCEVQVPGQEGLTEVTYVNLTSEGKVEVVPSAKHIKYEVTKSGTGCPGNNTEEATYTGKAVAEGFSENARKEFTVADTIEVK
jgi:hypothetical protein